MAARTFREKKEQQSRERGSEKIKANMNRGNKIFGKHIRQFLLPARAAQICLLDLLILMPFSLLYKYY